MPYRLSNLAGTEIYNVGYETERFDAQHIVANVIARSSSIQGSIETALASKTWRDFNGWSDWPPQHEGIIKAHDNGHSVCGRTISLQDVAAFDPLFWFFHCNWDRIWWAWQTKEDRKTLDRFEEVVSGDMHWLSEAPDTLLPPFDVNSAEMLNLADWNIDYEAEFHEVPVTDQIIISSRGHATASSPFRLPSTEKISVRVKNINRLDIPGSFDVVLYAGERAIDRTRIFQPSSPRECDNCTKHGTFSVDFIIDKIKLSDQSLRVAIEVESPSGIMDEIPMQNVGEPTVNLRLLVEEQ